MIERKQKLKKAVASAVLLCFTSLTGAQPLYAVPANTQLPDIAQAGAGVEISKPDNTVMNIHQEGQTAVNQWNNFSIGADAQMAPGQYAAWFGDRVIRVVPADDFRGSKRRSEADRHRPVAFSHAFTQVSRRAGKRGQQVGEEFHFHAPSKFII